MYVHNAHAFLVESRKSVGGLLHLSIVLYINQKSLYSFACAINVRQTTTSIFITDTHQPWITYMHTHSTQSLAAVSLLQRLRRQAGGGPRSRHSAVWRRVVTD